MVSSVFMVLEGTVEEEVFDEEAEDDEEEDAEDDHGLVSS